MRPHTVQKGAILPEGTSTITAQGNIFIVTGPSGVGKGVLCQRLLATLANLFLSVSATSRKPREGEVEGVDYYFMSPEDFRKSADLGEFLEWAQYNGNFYGTPKTSVEERLSRGQNILLEIEVQGALMVKERFPSACLIFVEPPSVEALIDRLRGRGKDSEDSIKSRIAIAREELKLKDRFDYVVMNDDLDACFAKIVGIIDHYQPAHA